MRTRKEMMTTKPMKYGAVVTFYDGEMRIIPTESREEALACLRRYTAYNFSSEETATADVEQLNKLWFERGSEGFDVTLSIGEIQSESEFLPAQKKLSFGEYVRNWLHFW